LPCPTGSPGWSGDLRNLTRRFTRERTSASLSPKLRTERVTLRTSRRGRSPRRATHVLPQQSPPLHPGRALSARGVSGAFVGYCVLANCSDAYLIVGFRARLREARPDGDGYRG
jgi:hypothetical protein